VEAHHRFVTFAPPTGHAPVVYLIQRKKMGKRLWLSIAAIVIAVAAGIYYYRSDVAAEAPTFSTAEVTQGDVVATVEATGTLEAVTTVEVGSQVSGTIKTLGADFNSQVRQGQVIAQLDPSLFDTQVAQERATVSRLNAEVERARVQAEDAKVKLGRAKDLAAQELIAKSDLDAAVSTANAADASVKSADAQLLQAQASLNQAQVNLSHTVIRAPIDGVVIARNVNVGQTVAASMQAPTLFVLAQNLKEMRVNASVDESDIGKIQNKQPVRFRVDAYPNETFNGTVSQIRLQPVVEQNVVSYVHGDRRPEPGSQAEARHDRGGHDRDRTRPTRRSRCRMRRCDSVRRRKRSKHSGRSRLNRVSVRKVNRPEVRRPALMASVATGRRRQPARRGVGPRREHVEARPCAGRSQRRYADRGDQWRSDARHACRDRKCPRRRTATAAAPSGSPLIPQGRRFGGGGGGGGGGNNAGGNGRRPAMSDHALLVRDLAKTYHVGEVDVPASARRLAVDRSR
jgi:RND family efflux transporter MFP subunit